MLLCIYKLVGDTKYRKSIILWLQSRAEFVVGEIQLYIVSWNNRIPLVFRNFQKCVAEINLQSVPLV